jgi:hypothetical protein
MQSGPLDPKPYLSTVYCLLLATSETDNVVARKHFGSIQEYGLQKDACFRPSYDLCYFVRSCGRQYPSMLTKLPSHMSPDMKPNPSP